MSDEAQQCFNSVAGALQDGDEATAFQIFVATWKTLSYDERRHLRDVINSELLSNKEREISAHGIFRTFRFWTVHEKAELVGFAGEVIGALRDVMGLPACIGYGTALGVARSNDLIAHDDDVDVVVAVPFDDYPTFKAGLGGIRSAFAAQPDFVNPEVFHGHMKFARASLTVDVFVAIQEGEHISSFPGPRKGILFKDVFPAKKIELFGASIEAPADPDTYLSKVYGPEWRTPNPLFGHNWSTEKFEDLIG